MDDSANSFFLACAARAKKLPLTIEMYYTHPKTKELQTISSDYFHGFNGVTEEGVVITAYGMLPWAELFGAIFYKDFESWQKHKDDNSYGINI